MSKITVAIAGLGSRGKNTYAQVLRTMPERCEVVALAEPIPERMQEAARWFGVPAERCFETVEEMLTHPKMADVLFVCTQDQQHVPHAIPALKKGYDVLLEKPISPELSECREILKVVQETGRKVAVCHVLRYAPFYRKIKEVLDSGALGTLTTIMGVENVGYWHQAHSFVRGNWRDSKTTSQMFLAKCCHDMDLMVWLTGKKCERLSSFGSLSHFRAECAPEGAVKRCLDGCAAKETCPYDAEKIYLYNERTGILAGKDGWPCDVLAEHPTEEKVREAIRNGPYGRCVYFCDNDVVDHQVVNLQMEDHLTVSFTMTAFSSGTGRYTKFMGTHGDMVADMDANTIMVTPFGGEPETYDFSQITAKMAGHAGGDPVLVKEFMDYINGAKPLGITSLEDSMESHFICMAAEESRVQGGAMIEMKQFR